MTLLPVIPKFSWGRGTAKHCLSHRDTEHRRSFCPIRVPSARSAGTLHGPLQHGMRWGADPIPNSGMCTMSTTAVPLAPREQESLSHKYRKAHQEKTESV